MFKKFFLNLISWIISVIILFVIILFINLLINNNECDIEMDKLGKDIANSCDNMYNKYVGRCEKLLSEYDSIIQKDKLIINELKKEVAKCKSYDSIRDR